MINLTFGIVMHRCIYRKEIYWRFHEIQYNIAVVFVLRLTQPSQFYLK